MWDKIIITAGIVSAIFYGVLFYMGVPVTTESGEPGRIEINIFKQGCEIKDPNGNALNLTSTDKDGSFVIPKDSTFSGDCFYYK